jgi:NifU-like domain
MKTSICFVASLATTFAFSVLSSSRTSSLVTTGSSTLLRDIISPFDDNGDRGDVATASEPVRKLEGPLDLTWENVDAVLDEMRPFLIQDGGNVKIQEIDGPVVKLQLEVSIRTNDIHFRVQSMFFDRYDSS